MMSLGGGVFIKFSVIIKARLAFTFKKRSVKSCVGVSMEKKRLQFRRLGFMIRYVLYA